MYHFQGGHQAANYPVAAQPPAKRHKGNQVITRFPPPPSYGVPPGQATQGGWPAPGYSPQSYPGHQQYPQQQYPQQQYSPQYPYGQPYPAQNYPQQPYQQHPQQYPPAYSQSQQYSAQYPQQYGQSQTYPGFDQAAVYQGYQGQNGWQQASPASAPGHQPTGQPQYGHTDPSAAPIQSGQPTSGTSSFGHGDLSAQYNGHSNHVVENQPEDVMIESDFFREASFAKDGDAPAADVSINMVVYYPPRPVKTVLPPTFEEAQEQMIKALRREREDESISKYFISSEAANFESSVRSSSEWERIRDDALFYQFPPLSEAAFTPLATVRSDRYRQGSPSPLSATSAESGSPSRDASDRSASGEERSPADEAVVDGHEDGEAMDTDTDDDEIIVPRDPSPVKREQRGDDSIDIKAETTPAQVKKVEDGIVRSPKDESGDDKPQDSRASTASDQPRKKQKKAARNKGSSRNAFPQSNGRRYSNAYDSNDGHRRESWYDRSEYRSNDDHRRNSGFNGNGFHQERRRSSNNGPSGYGPHNVPPPPQTEYRTPTPWNQMPHDRPRRSSQTSNTSQRTVSGGDFDTDMQGDTHRKTPRPPEKTRNQPGSGRKRGYDEIDRSSDNEGGGRQYDDVTPRLHRGRPKIPDAYSRRW